MSVMMAIQDFEESEKMRFERKVAIVTGGNSGIGKEVARRFVAEGGRVVVNGRNAAKTEAASKEIDLPASVPWPMSVISLYPRPAEGRVPTYTTM